MKTVALRQCTRTLRFPSLQDVYDIITSHDASEGLLNIDLKQLTVAGDVKGQAVSPALHYKATVDRHLVIASGTSVHISNGVLVIPPACALMLSGPNISFSNVCIVGEGLRKLNRDPYLICVHGINSQATFDDCILECDSRHNNANTLVVRSGAICSVNSSRVVASLSGNAIKVQGGHVVCKKRSLVQGGIFVTSGGRAAAPAPQIDAKTSQWQRSKGGAQPQPPRIDGGADEQEGKKGADQQQEPQAEVTREDSQEYGAEGLPGLQQQHHLDTYERQRHDQGHDQQCSNHEQYPQVCSSVSLKNSEIRGGTVCSISTFGSGSKLEAEGCIIGNGNASFGCHAAKGSRIEIVGCEVTSNVAGAVVTGGGTLVANKCTFEGGKLGLLVERQGRANLRLCKVNSQAAPAAAPDLPSPPKPGFLPSFHTLPASVEVRHAHSLCTAIDCKFGELEGYKGELGVHCIQGGRFALEAGVVVAMEGVRGHLKEFV